MAKKPKKPSIIKLILLIAALAAVCAVAADLITGFAPPSVVLGDDTMTVKSREGITVRKRDIDYVILAESIPQLTRGGGFGVGGTQKGEVTIDSLGPGFAYVYTENPPFVYIKLLNLDNFIYINLGDPAETRELYERLTGWVG